MLSKNLRLGRLDFFCIKKTLLTNQIQKRQNAMKRTFNANDVTKALRKSGHFVCILKFIALITQNSVKSAKKDLEPNGS